MKIGFSSSIEAFDNGMVSRSTAEMHEDLIYVYTLNKVSKKIRWARLTPPKSIINEKRTKQIYI